MNSSLTLAPHQANHHQIQHVHYHGAVYSNVYQNGGDVAITTNAINGGGGPPNGPFAAGGAAGPGAAAGTGAGADPPLLGGDEAGLSTPPIHPTRDDLESMIESTVTKALRGALPTWLQELRGMAENNGDNSMLENIIAHQERIMARVS